MFVGEFELEEQNIVSSFLELWHHLAAEKRITTTSVWDVSQ